MKIRQIYFETETEQQTEWAALLSITTAVVHLQEVKECLSLRVSSPHLMFSHQPADTTHVNVLLAQWHIVRPSTEKADVLLHFLISILILVLFEF